MSDVFSVLFVLVLNEYESQFTNLHPRALIPSENFEEQAARLFYITHITFSQNLTSTLSLGAPERRGAAKGTCIKEDVSDSSSYK